MGPPAILAGIAVALMSVHQVIGIILLILIILGAIAYWFFLSVRLWLAIPALFLDNTSAVQAIKNTWNKTKGKFGKVIVFWLIFLFSSSAISSLIAQPYNETIVALFMQNSFIIVILLNIIGAIIFVLMQSVVQAMLAAYYLWSYKEL